MPKKMLIDASHPEETRVVIVDGQRVEDFDFESSSRKPLKGNIYLAKVTRIEPSLQAAFVEYGGNRHGFLAFSEIHPDYYQIPVADRQALIAAEQAESERSAAYEPAESESRNEQVPQEPANADESGEPDMTLTAQPAESLVQSGPEFSDLGQTPPEAQMQTPGEYTPETASPLASADYHAEADRGTEDMSVEAMPLLPDDPAHAETAAAENISEVPAQPGEVESVGGEDALEEVPSRRARHIRSYKIQEVIKRRQILLVQVVKEERGNKGAALTTYLSLAGRYCVLMPNTPRGGGISRKITNQNDRRRLKDIAGEMEVPQGMGVIVRTAGASRTRQEIRRDYEYLLRLWETVRAATLQASAPALIYEEGNLIKRTIRDNFSKEIEECLIQGEDAYKEATEFMRMLMPSQLQAVKLWNERAPLFQAYRVESQLDSMFSPRVQLRSGGYIVINATEALVAIDVNSGKSTREHSIEETALRTNLEAADEISRQLRLRDLAGLIVIDFIDMEEGRNNRLVERRLKECLRHDRARIQVGRISPFGLMEMSRQRLRPGVVEGSTVPCPHCTGTGIIRSTESLSLRVLRALEEDGARGREKQLTARVPSDVALYLLNQKRHEIARIEDRLGLTVYVEAKTALLGADYEIVPGVPENFRARRAAEAAIRPESALEGLPPEAVEAEEIAEAAEPAADAAYAPETSELEQSPHGGREERAERDEFEPRRGRRRRRGRRGGRDHDHRHEPREEREHPAPAEAAAGTEASYGATPSYRDEGSADFRDQQGGHGDQQGRRRRRRGRRGGRRHRRHGEHGFEQQGQDQHGQDGQSQGNGGYRQPAREPARQPERKPEPAMQEAAPAPNPAPREAKPERSGGIAAFFGFGSSKSPGSESGEAKPARRGWWQKK